MTWLLVFHILLSVVLIILVFMQYGRGADMSAGMGGGGSANSVFGASGSADFISKFTGVVGVLFFVSSLGVGVLYKKGAMHGDVSVKSLMQDYKPRAPISSPDLPKAPSASIPSSKTTVQPLKDAKSVKIEGVEHPARGK
jgi:preprotein translocase subunit SecG